MGKVRVWYHPGGKVSITHGDLSRNPKQEVKLKLRFRDSDFDDIDDSQLPNAANPTDRKDRDR